MLSESNCSFVNELVTKADVLQWIDIPLGSGNLAGVQIRVVASVDIPEGWIVQRGAGDENGPLTLSVGTVASVYSPESCRPLVKPASTTTLDCSFMDTLRARADIIQLLYIPTGSDKLAGAQIRVVTPIDIPVGWVVQRGAGDEYGPIVLPVGTVASVYSPESCRPLR